MKIRKQVMMVSGPNRRGEFINPEGLAVLVDHLKHNYIYVDIEHDPRLPPIGRVSDANLVTLADGRQAVEAKIELFEPGDKPDFQKGSKSLITHDLPSDHLQVQYDENYRDVESQNVINELRNMLQAGEPKYFSKNSLDALTILTFAGAFVLGGVGSGFLNQMGSDIYAKFKECVGRLIRNKGKKHKDNLLAFDFNVSNDDRHIVVRILCCNPTDQDLDDIYFSVIPELDCLLIRYFEGNEPLAHLVFQKDGSELKLLYGVRCDGFSLRPAYSVVLRISPTTPLTEQ